MAFTVDVAKAVKKLNNQIGFLQPLYESIANSLEAHASEITVSVIPDVDWLNDSKQKVLSFSIFDNGDGFTERNLQSFSELWSDHKIEMGCKGVGRLTWLKVFDNVKIESLANGQEVKIDFNTRFDSSKSIHKKPSDTVGSYSKITFSDVTLDFLNQTKDKPKDRYDKRAIADAQQLKQLVEEHLMAKLFLLKNKDKRSFVIKFIVGADKAEINSDNLQDLQVESFSVQSNFDDTSFNFTLYYDFMENQKKSHQHSYCANGRVVRDFPEEVTYKKLPDGYSSIALLTSPYFDSRVNDERNEFTMSVNENNADLNNPVPFPKINAVLKNNIQNILTQHFPELTEKNQEVVEDTAQEYPHLREYIEKDSSLIKSKSELIKSAEKRFKEDKEKTKSEFSALLRKQEVPDEEFEKILSKVSDVSAKELAEYIAYRQQIIIGLEKLHKDREKQESLLHNLFMKKKTDDITRHPSASNIWLLDDKFMSYFYLASDKAISTIYDNLYPLPQKGASPLARKVPDLFGVYLNDVNDLELETPQDIVIIEFKAINAGVDEKDKSITEIWRNTMAVRQVFNNIRSIWTFIITDIDPVFELTLTASEFRKSFTTGEDKVYHKYNEAVDTHCYAISVGAIIADANKRNSIFLDIISGNRS